MKVLEVIKKRRSVRKYKKDPIPEEALLRVLEAARLAPSGKNFQPWKFIIVKDKALKEKLAQASAGQFFMAEAPIIIVGCGFPDNCYAHMVQSYGDIYRPRFHVTAHMSITIIRKTAANDDNRCFSHKKLSCRGLS